jgi:hypothetical protein
MRLGAGAITNLRLGSQQVQAVYLGATKVWPMEAQPLTTDSLLRDFADVNYGTLVGGQMLRWTGTKWEPT